MNTVTTLLIVSQLIFTVIAAMYFYQALKSQNSNKSVIHLESKKELENLKKLRSIHLTTPLSEKTRPKNLEEIQGQEQGIKALKATLCSPNPQHVLIYGPPGVGKTAAARLILEEAKKNTSSPFQEYSKFVEIDATTLRFDERSIADPLIGSVHDPIYQGAGIYGSAGVPQPKAGAVTKAHGGVLFIDEIGELHPIQMNKLLKVLEDRVAKFTSSYYSEENALIPTHIHEIFKKGLPADFRLIGATTRKPQEIPPALRSRCTEVFFNELNEEQIQTISRNAVLNAGFLCEDNVDNKISEYAANGREAVNIVQTAVSVASMEGRNFVKVEDIEWVAEAGHYVVRPNRKIGTQPKIGVVNGLAVYNDTVGALLNIEATAQETLQKGTGIIKVTGIVEEEELKNGSGNIRRKSTARSSIENVITVLETITGIVTKNYDIHINFPGGMPVDGPSAGTAIFCAVYSALLKKPISNKIAMTGELSIHGAVLPVGGVTAKILAAKEAGAEIILIPDTNWQKNYETINLTIKRIENITSIIKIVFNDDYMLENIEKKEEFKEEQVKVLTAEGA